jgi:hypothetical protein
MNQAKSHQTPTKGLACASPFSLEKNHELGRSQNRTTQITGTEVPVTTIDRKCTEDIRELGSDDGRQ